ncbi:ATP-grasp domain-containing protein [Burkholderia sp. Cy-637]|uniref:ATP-grasp domain-containing protein n=1 Tax=Burkholderia sp. Cy-637 TaxID=2608327 RepID=UPI001420C76B|nr:ATP-grasp domain-containing protein [Burkholderia sp. Cy-637]NIF89965.1 ATP-grasp domain-containing protein [Burkholderia sp. Cy-637]
MAHLVFVETTRPGIQALEAAKQAGHTVSLITSGKFDWLLDDAGRQARARLVDHSWSAEDTQDPDAVHAALRACLAAHRVDAVLSTLHMCALPAAMAAEREGLRGTSVAGIQNARNKARCRDLLVAAGVPSVRHALVGSIEAARAALREIGYPVIVKPATGMGKVLTSIVHDDAALAAHFAQAAAQIGGLEEGVRDEISLEFVIEEIAVGPLYSIEVAASAHGEWAPLAIVRRKTGRHNPVLEMGSSIPSGLSDDEYQTAADYAIRVVKTLGLDLGFFHVEFIYTREGPQLVEVNPRIAGGAIPDLIRAASGVNLFELLVRVYLGERLDLGRLPTHLAASHSFLGADHDCVVREDLPPDWFEPFLARLHSGSADIRPGMMLRRMDTNYGVAGVVRMTADSYAEVVRQVAGIRAEVEQVLGIKLVEIND